MEELGLDHHEGRSRRHREWSGLPSHSDDLEGEERNTIGSSLASMVRRFSSRSTMDRPAESGNADPWPGRGIGPNPGWSRVSPHEPSETVSSWSATVLKFRGISRNKPESSPLRTDLDSGPSDHS